MDAQYNELAARVAAIEDCLYGVPVGVVLTPEDERAIKVRRAHTRAMKAVMNANMIAQDLHYV